MHRKLICTTPEGPPRPEAKLLHPENASSPMVCSALIAPYRKGHRGQSTTLTSMECMLSDDLPTLQRIRKGHRGQTTAPREPFDGLQRIRKGHRGPTPRCCTQRMRAIRSYYSNSTVALQHYSAVVLYSCTVPG